MSDAQGYVFVSYAHADKDEVAVLVRALERRGISFRFDQHLEAGVPWEQALKDLLADAGAVLVVWSASSGSSASVIRVASVASDRLVPVTLTGIHDVPKPFQGLPTVDLDGWNDDPGDPRLDQVEQALRQRLSSHSGPARASGASEQTPATDVGGLAATDPERALAVAQSIVDEHERSRALADIAQALALAGQQAQGMAVAQSIVDKDVRSRALEGIAQVASAYDPDVAAAINDTAAVDTDRSQPSTEVEFSASVRQARQELSDLNEPVTAARLAAALQPHHPGYGDGLFEKVVLNADVGPRRSVNAWLEDVAGLYDPAAVESSAHQVLDGKLVLAGLAELDPDVGTMLEGDGFLTALRGEIEVAPRAVAGPGIPARDAAVLSRETLFDFSTDTPGLTDDVTASDDRLGIEDDVRTLCRLALARSTKPPLAIGLFGDWGTGKSFFMRRMQTRIREMQDDAVMSLGRGGSSPYCDNVVQIPFNAWHYADSNLWASLMTRIFEGLTPACSDTARDYLFRRLESTRVRMEQAQRDADTAGQQLDAIQTERSRLERARSAISGQGGASVSSVLGLLASPDLPGDESAPQPPQGITTLSELRQAALDARSTARLLRRLLDWWPFRILLVIAALVVLGGLGVMAAGGGGLVVRAVSTAAVVVPTVAATAGIAWRRFRDIVNTTSQADQVEQWIISQLAAIEQRERRLTHDREQAQELAEGAARTLDSVRAGNLLRQYVEDRVTNQAYRDQLGVIALVREDLRRLSDLLSPTDNGAGVLSITARFDIQRVILYIDDLDRCPPDRVVEVLQAVHLLLAFPLFVVIAGVDSRWLITSLGIHYQRLLHSDEGSGQEPRTEADEWEATPADYLEKIFQIPLALRPMSDDGYRALVKNLMPVRAPAMGDVPALQDEPATATADQSGKAKADLVQQPPHVQSGTVMPPAREVRRFAIEGNPLAARFVIGGRRLVLVTDAGIWVWNQGMASASRQVSAQLRNLSFSADSEQLVYEADDGWITLDLATAAQATYQRPEDAVAVAAGQQTGEIVYATQNRLFWRRGEERNSQSWTDGPIIRLLIAADRLLVRGASALFVLRLPELSNTQLLTADTEQGSVVDMAFDHRDGTLYTLHPDQVRIWLWSGDSWGTSPDFTVQLTGTAPLAPGARLMVGQVGVFVIHPSGLLHVTRRGPMVIDVSDVAAPDVGAAELFADPSTAGIVRWSSRTVTIARPDGMKPVETARFSVDPVNTAALSPSGGLVATVGGGSCQLWYVGGTFEDEDVSQLELAPEEATFIAILGPVVPTARAAKRLVNVYRVLRASHIGREKLQDPESGEYKIALLLLSLVTGWPHLALLLLRELDDATTGTWLDLLDAIHKKEPTQDEFLFARGPGRGDENLDVLRALRKLSEDAPTELNRYRAWAPHIRRFSMLTASQRTERHRQAQAPSEAGR